MMNQTEYIPEYCWFIKPTVYSSLTQRNITSSQTINVFVLVLSYNQSFVVQEMSAVNSYRTAITWFTL